MARSHKWTHSPERRSRMKERITKRPAAPALIAVAVAAVPRMSPAAAAPTDSLSAESPPPTKLPIAAIAASAGRTPQAIDAAVKDNAPCAGEYRRRVRYIIIISYK